MPEPSPIIDRFAASDKTFSIVVIGAMNPAIHHPAWYQSIGLISEDECSSAVGTSKRRQTGTVLSYSTEEAVCTPVFSQFTAGPIRVACIPENWSVTTIERGMLNRAEHICLKVFEALKHTPVSSFALNFLFHKQTRLKNVGERFANLASQLPLGVVFEESASRSAKIHFVSSAGDRVVNVAVEPSVRGNDRVYVGVTCAHTIQAKGFFDLDQYLVPAMKRDSQDANDLVSRVVDAVNAME